VSETRVDPLTGAVVVVVESRQDRPNLPAGCPFCPGGLEAPEPYDVRWFRNRWPAMPDDRCEIVLFSPDHDASLGGLGPSGLRRVIDLWAERTAELGSRDDVEYVLLFENRGAEVGATIHHPHGQIYAFDHVPEVVLREDAGGACALCADAGGDRTVATSGDWHAVVPWAPSWPYELLVSSAEHVPDLPSLSDGDRDALSAVLSDGLVRLDRLFDAPMPYMLWVHQRPTDGGDWPLAHLHLHVAPLLRQPGVPRFVAAGELGSGVWFDPIAPEEAAAALRALPGSA
jgi:UDPglucose--hexose-1-phosphate uridylyltransferase